MTGTPDSVPTRPPSLGDLPLRAVRRRLEELFEAPSGSSTTHVVVPTSGSTGEPRRVALSAGALRSSGEATAARTGGHGQWLLALPTTHVAGLQVVARSVLAGTEPITWNLADGFRSVDFAAAAARMTGARRYTSLVPTQAHRLVEDARAGRPHGAAALAALASFDAVLLGGAATSPALLAALRAAAVTVIRTYGMSETSGGCVYDGVPLTGVAVRLNDGCIEISGTVLADGYVDDARATDDLFVTEGNTRWYRTNDMGALSPDGLLTVLGRADDVLVTGGVNVAPAAVEALLSGWDGIIEACIVGLPDEEWGTRVVAVVTVDRAAPDAPSSDVLLSRVRARVTDTLGAPAAPRHVVVLDELPLRGPGKVDRRAAAEQAARRLGWPLDTH